MSDTSTTPAASASTNERLASRLEAIANSVTTLQKTSEERDTRSKIAAYGQRLSSDLSAAETAIANAERALAQAHDDGDGSVIASKQRELTEAVTAKGDTQRKLNDHKAALATYEREQQLAETKAKAAPPPPAADAAPQEADTTNLNKWTEANKDWYGTDTELTNAAHAVDKAIREAGVISVGSKAYFEAVDRQMANKFPDRFQRSASGAGGGGGGGDTTGRASTSGGRISASILQGWRRMGINVDDPDTMKRMIKHRERAVHKGILPDSPVNGPILS